MFRDRLDRTVYEGDTIALAVRDGNSAKLVIRTVVDYERDKGVVVMRNRSSGRFVRTASLYNIVKIG